MTFSLHPLLALVLAAQTAATPPPSHTPAPVGPTQFTFVALGDTTYSAPADYPLYEKLIGAINAASPAFALHIGDTKGRGDCGRPVQERQRAFFDEFQEPVFYTPGNNEWAECWRPNRNSGDPLAIIATMREVFWARPESMGARKLPLVRQADENASFKEFAENARWHYGAVTFATINEAGTYNNQELRSEPLWKDFIRREQANLAWVQAAFADARARGDRALVLAFHPNIFDERLQYENGPFDPLVKLITKEADAFPGQVLIVHGHYHQFTVDRPLTELDTDKPDVRHRNVTRLEVFGWPDMKAVRVSVDTSTPWVFGFAPLYADESVSTHPLG